MMAKLRRARTGSATALLATLASCGLTVTGSDVTDVTAGDASPDVPTGDAPSRDGQVLDPDADAPGDAQVEPDGGGVIDDGGGVIDDGGGVIDDGGGVIDDGGGVADATPEASIPVDAGCVPTVDIDDSLTSIDTQRWSTPSNDNGHPTVVNNPPGGGGAMVALVPMQKNKRGGLWLKTPVPTHAFDVTFEYLVECPNNAFCADGFAAAWIDTTDATVLGTANVGGELGLPQRNGGAMTITLVKNMQSGQALAPVTFATRRLSESTVPPGPSQGSNTNDGYVQQRRTVELSVRNGSVTAKIGNSTISQPTTAGFTGLFGLTAATGGEVDRVYVSKFRGRFYACDPP